MCSHYHRAVLLAFPAQIGHGLGHDDLRQELLPGLQNVE